VPTFTTTTTTVHRHRLPGTRYNGYNRHYVQTESVQQYNNIYKSPNSDCHSRVSSRRGGTHIAHKAAATVASASASAAAADFPWEHDGGAVAVVVDVSIATGRRDVPQPFTHRPCTYTTRVPRALVRRFRHQQVSSCARPSRQRLLQENRKIRNKRRELLPLRDTKNRRRRR